MASVYAETCQSGNLYVIWYTQYSSQKLVNKVML